MWEKVTVKDKVFIYCSAFTLYSLKQLSFFLSSCPALIFLSVQRSGAISPDVLVELLVIKEYMEWKGWSDGGTGVEAMDGWDAGNVITESMQLAEIVLTFQSRTLLSKDVSYGPISLWDRLEAFGTHVVLPIHMEY